MKRPPPSHFLATLDPLVLLWLGQNGRAEKAVDDLFDGMTIGASSNNSNGGGIRATKSTNNHSTSSVVAATIDGGGGTSMSTDLSTGATSSAIGGIPFRKGRVIFPDDFRTVDGVASASTTSLAAAAAATICPTPGKIKKEDDGTASPRSRLSDTSLSNTARLVTNGAGNGAGTSQQTNTPIARKRSAYQASIVTADGGALVRNSNNQVSSGLLKVESSPEVSSSQNCSGISPVPSLESSEIDLELWDLDIHESSTSHSSGTLSLMVVCYEIFVCAGVRQLRSAISSIT